MTPSTLGILIGAVLAVVAVTTGFWAMVVVALFIAIGWAVGRVVEGRLDLRGVADAVRGRRSS